MSASLVSTDRFQLAWISASGQLRTWRVTASRVASEETPKSLSPQELRDAGDEATPSVTRQNVRCDDRSWDALERPVGGTQPTFRSRPNSDARAGEIIAPKRTFQSIEVLADFRRPTFRD